MEENIWTLRGRREHEADENCIRRCFIMFIVFTKYY
jgi:hypothetical protein